MITLRRTPLIRAKWMIMLAVTRTTSAGAGRDFMTLETAITTGLDVIEECPHPTPEVEILPTLAVGPRIQAVEETQFMTILAVVILFFHALLVLTTVLVDTLLVWTTPRQTYERRCHQWRWRVDLLAVCTDQVECLVRLTGRPVRLFKDI